MKAVFLTLGLATMAVSGSAMADLALAKKSGCLACHSVEKKIVGPAWKDVGAKYKGDAGAKARLVEKVKKGGKGVWGNAPMPPYSPRVSDENIGKLVDFVLSLGK
jgi:cytochrome c